MGTEITTRGYDDAKTKDDQSIKETMRNAI